MHERRLFHTFNWPLPISLTLRNGLLVVLLLSSIAVFWQPLSALYFLTREQSHYSHLLLVPLVSAYAFYQNRKVILTSGEWSPISGLMMVGLGALGYWEAPRATNGVEYVSLSTLSLVIVTWGIFLFCYGPGICRTFSFGLFFLLCMVPFPAGLLHSMIVFLQRSAVEGVDLGFSLLNIPVIRDGTVFVLPNITIRVDEGCSGIRSTISLIITSIVAGHFCLRSGLAKLSLVAVAVPLAIMDNIFRILGLSLLANYVNTRFLLDGSLHDLGGHILFVVSIAILIVLLSLLRKLEQRPRLYAVVRAEV
jgi:exosortase